MNLMTEKLWTCEDLARYCQVKISVVRYWLRNTDIPFIKLGRNYRFDPKDIKDWIGKQKNTRIARSQKLNEIY